jgi:HK97 family phage major capsid protein
MQEEKRMPKTMAQLQENIRDLGAKVRTSATALAEAAGDDKTPMDTLQAQRDGLKTMTDRMAALQASYDAQYAEGAEMLPAQMDTRESRELSGVLKSREYARAFVNAIRAGAQPKRMTDPGHKVLYDALTIAGDPAGGQDGGFLVPEDIDVTIPAMRGIMASIDSWWVRSDRFGRPDREGHRRNNLGEDVRR